MKYFIFVVCFFSVVFSVPNRNNGRMDEILNKFIRGKPSNNSYSIFIQNSTRELNKKDLQYPQFVKAGYVPGIVFPTNKILTSTVSSTDGITKKIPTSTVSSTVGITENPLNNLPKHNDTNGNDNQNHVINYPEDIYNLTNTNENDNGGTHNDTHFHEDGNYDHSHEDDDHVHYHEESDKNEDDYKGLRKYNTEGKILVVTDKDSLPPPDREGLSSNCQYGRNYTLVTCEHQPLIENIDTLLLDKSMIPDEAEFLTIRGYDRVEVAPNTFANKDLNLILILFENVSNIVLHKHSFLFGSTASYNRELILKIVGCGIAKIPTLTLTNSAKNRHGTRVFKPEKKRFLSVEFDNCKIGTMESKALYGANLIYLNITDSHIKVMKTKSIDLNIYEMVKIKNNYLPSFQMETLCFHAKKTVFINNHMKEITNHSIIIETDGQVSFEFNKVEYLHAYGLAGIVPKAGVYGASIVFLMNNVQRVEPNSLFVDGGFPSHERRVLNNSFQIDCACNISQSFELLMGIQPGQQYDKSSYENALENSQCMQPETQRFVYIDEFIEGQCKEFPIVIVSIVSVAIALFLISVTVCVVCSLRIQRVKEEANMVGDCSSQSFSTLSKLQSEQGDKFNFPEGCHSPAFTWVTAAPEMKTYQQNQLPEFTTELTESICESARNSTQPPTEFEKRIMDRVSRQFNN